ncbi:MAG: cation-translocating P-type ATPase [Armatimonadetes bacterium]|nr:cation-translocating P-type ATPase [Armatimonadota bacterium]
MRGAPGQPVLWQQLLIFALLPVLVGALTLAAWLLGRAELGPVALHAGLALLAIVLGGWQRFLAGIQDVLGRRITVNVFVTVAILVTVAAGHFVPAAVIILIMSVVGALESYTLDKTRRSIRDLLDLTPPTANVRRGEEEVVVPVAELLAGDIVVVRPGERIPVDGVVTTGLAAVNQAPITGESLPVEKSVDSDVFSGTLNESGRLEVRTTKVGADTTLAKIVHLVEEAQDAKAPITGIADHFTTWFLPTVLVLAIIGYLLSHDMKVAVAILLVACPCAFAIATPSAVAAGIANMARRAVLIKGGAYFEAAGKIDTLLMDKTGTLTFGRPKVMDVVSTNALPEDEVLRLAAIAEKYSEHPLGRAVTALAAEQGLDVPDADEFKAEVGMGATATHAGAHIVVGKGDLLREHGILVPKSVEHACAAQAALGRTAILVGQGLETVGFLGIADEVKPEAVEAVAALKQLGFSHIAILTGDNARVAREVARQVGADAFHADLLPEDKQRIIRDWQAKGKAVAMIGDGLNDAPSLALADVGIVMGAAGTHVAIDAADVTLMNDDLLRFVEFVRMSRKVLRRIKLNIFFSMVYNVIGLTLAMLGHLSPVVAVIFQEAGCVTVVLSSTLLLWTKAAGAGVQANTRSARAGAEASAEAA